MAATIGVVDPRTGDDRLAQAPEHDGSGQPARDDGRESGYRAGGDRPRRGGAGDLLDRVRGGARPGGPAYTAKTGPSETYPGETPPGGMPADEMRPRAPAYAPEPSYAPEPRTLPEPPPSGERTRKPLWRRALGPLIALGILLFKFGAKLKGLLLLLPKVKFVSTGLSMLVSIGAYALIWTWKFAVGFVLLILVHEMGHVLQLRREGIKASAPMFIPFVGAAVMMKELPEDAAAEARVGLAGPVLGTLGVAAPLALFFATGDDLFRALAYVGFFLNLINLLPVLPLDGGRAMAALAPWMWLLGFAVLIVLMLFFFTPIMLLVALLGGLETWRRFKARKSPESRRFHRVKPQHRVAIAAVYLGLLAVTAAGTHLSFLPKALSAV